MKAMGEGRDGERLNLPYGQVALTHTHSDTQTHATYYYIYTLADTARARHEG